MDTGSGAALRVAVKDVVDVAGVPTTAGCAAIARQARAAVSDAACLAGLRSAVTKSTAVISGKTNLDELALGVSGVNQWFGTPVNPLDPTRAPGGSSSGSATSVASHQADVAIGTDTGGSIRIPAACCGIAGLKTTSGRISLVGTHPLAPSLDTVGPMAGDMAGLLLAMALLEPGFDLAAPLEGPIARLRPQGADGSALRAAPEVDRAIDAALRLAGLEVVDVPISGWLDAARATLVLIAAESYAVHGRLAAAHPEEVSGQSRVALAEGARVGHQALIQARSYARRWRARLSRELERFAALALPVLDDLPPPLHSDLRSGFTVRWTAPVNLAGLPALAIPVPCTPMELPGAVAPFPTSLQLIGPAGSEAGLIGLGARIEAAVATL